MREVNRMRLIDADALLMNMNLAIAILEGTMKNLGLQDDAECQMELKAYRNIRDGIKDEPTAEPTAQPEPHWIPCTERMPHNTGDFYLCTAKLSVDDEYEVELLMLDTANDFDKSYFSKCIHNGLVFRESWSGGNEALDVIAWMPLPEPYRGGEK